MNAGLYPSTPVTLTTARGRVRTYAHVTGYTEVRGYAEVLGYSRQEAADAPA